MSSSALRRRRQAIKKQRAELKRELAAIEAEMESRKDSVVDLPHDLADRVARLREKAKAADVPQLVASPMWPGNRD